MSLSYEAMVKRSSVGFLLSLYSYECTAFYMELVLGSSGRLSKVTWWLTHACCSWWGCLFLSSSLQITRSWTWGQCCLLQFFPQFSNLFLGDRGKGLCRVIRYDPLGRIEHAIVWLQPCALPQGNYLSLWLCKNALEVVIWYLVVPLKLSSFYYLVWVLYKLCL